MGGQPDIGQDTGALGAFMRPRYMGRDMTTYPVTDSEMGTISFLNTESTVFFSIGTLMIGLGGSIWTNAVFYTELTTEGKIATHFVAPFFMGAALLFITLGIVAACRRMSRWRAIKSESYTTSITVPAPTIAVPPRE